jgi:hypothetical protein
MEGMNFRIQWMAVALVSLFAFATAHGDEISEKILLQKVPGLRIVTNQRVIDCDTGQSIPLPAELPASAAPFVHNDGGRTTSGIELVIVDQYLIAVDIRGSKAYLPMSPVRISTVGPGNQGRGSHVKKSVNFTVTNDLEIIPTVRTEDEKTSEALESRRIIAPDGEWRFRNDPDFNKKTYQVFHTPIGGEEIEVISSGVGRVLKLLPGAVLKVGSPLPQVPPGQLGDGLFSYIELRPGGRTYSIRGFRLYDSPVGDRNASIAMRTTKVDIHAKTDGWWALERTIDLSNILHEVDMFWNNSAVWSADGTRLYLHAQKFNESLLQGQSETIQIIECNVLDGTTRVIWKWEQPLKQPREHIISVYCVDPTTP